jgi:hypothetical protein
MPCADDVSGDNTEISYQVNDTDTDHNETADLCSPLCICNCCQTHLVVQQIFISDINVPSMSSQRDCYTEPITSGFVDSLFQPPRV